MVKPYYINRLNNLNNFIWNNDKEGVLCRDWDDFAENILHPHTEWESIQSNKLALEAIQRGEFIVDKIKQNMKKEYEYEFNSLFIV